MALNSGGGGGSAGAIKAGSAFVTLFTKNNLAAGLNSAAKDLKAFGSRVSGLGRAFVGLGAAGAASLIPMANTLSDLAKQGSIANALGLTSEQFTGIAAVAKSVGNDTKEFIESLVTLGKLGSDAAAGTEQASQAFADLGLNANEFIKLRADEQFFQVFESLNKIQDPLKRTRALMLAFGEDGGKILLPLLGKSGDELRKMAAGFAISGDDMAKATKAASAYTDATTALSRAWQSVSVAAAPFVKMLGEGIASGVNVFREWVNANREVVVGVGLAVGGVSALGLGMMALGPAIGAVSAAWAGFTGIVSGGLAVIGAVKAIILTPILAIPAALAAAGGAFLVFTDTGRAIVGQVAGGIGSMFGETWRNISSGWRAVVHAIGDGELNAAFNIAVATAEIEWNRFVNYLQTTWESWISFFVKTWDDAVSAIDTAWNNVVSAIDTAWTDFLNTGFGRTMDGAFQGMVAWIEDIAEWFQWLADLIGNVWDKTIGFIEERWELFANSKFKKGLDKAAEGLKYWIEDAWTLLTDWEIKDPEGLKQPVAGLIEDKPAGLIEDKPAGLILGPQAESPKERRDRELQERQAARDAMIAARLAGKDWLGGGGEWGKNNPLAPQLNNLAIASRGTFGGSASSGFFGGSGGVGEKIVGELKKQNEIGEKTNKLLGNLRMGDGSLLFVGGK